MLCRFVYLLVRRLLDVLSGGFRSRLEKDVEIAVLRMGCQNSIKPLIRGCLLGRERPACRPFKAGSEPHKPDVAGADRSEPAARARIEIPGTKLYVMAFARLEALGLTGGHDGGSWSHPGALRAR
jgi:hypothetical protein